MTQLPLLDWQPPPQIFGPRHGETFEPKRDLDRLNDQMRRVYNVMCGNDWFTLGELSKRTGDPEASISARIRDLRKQEFGGFTVPKEYVGKGLWRYRLIA